METRHIHISDYNYPLPDERIAKFPMSERDHSKLLIYRHGDVAQDMFFNLPDYLPKDALMVFNNTKVIRARMYFHKDTGARIEVFLLEPAEPSDYEQMFHTTHHCSWYCLVGNLKKWKDGALSQTINVNSREIRLSAIYREAHSTSHRIDFEWDDDTVSFADIIEAVGELPIPPYLNRETQESDNTTYQTVYSKKKGSVAAPTAGLHFTQRVLEALDAHGIEREELTLHVGAGTFKPVKSEEIADHEMHTEYFSVNRHTLSRLIAHHGEAIAVGTTSVRTLESLYYIGRKLLHNPRLSEAELHVSQWEPYDERIKDVDTIDALHAVVDYLDSNDMPTLNTGTQIIIAPGYRYKIVKMLITNFHQPQSTLLLLVSALVGDKWHQIYDYALSHDFRFLSYGDSSLLIP